MRVANFTSVTSDGCTWTLVVDQSRWPTIPPQFLHVEWTPADLDLNKSGKRLLTPMLIDLKDLGYAVSFATAARESDDEIATALDDLVVEST